MIEIYKTKRYFLEIRLLNLEKHSKIGTFPKVLPKFLIEVFQWWSMRIFFNLLRDTPDNHRFPTLHMVKTHFLLENL